MPNQHLRKKKSDLEDYKFLEENSVTIPVACEWRNR